MKRIHHLSDDRAGANDRHLHDDVVKTLRAQTRQGRHLRAAFYLKQTDGVGLLQRGIDLRIVLRKMSEVDFFVGSDCG